MTVTVNGAPTEHVGSIADLVAARDGGRAARGIAVAVNDEVVPRASWETFIPHAGDRIEIVTAVQGG